MTEQHQNLQEVYQAGPIKRKRRTRRQVEQLDEQIIQALEADHPQSVRHIFYLMTNPRLPEPVEKTDNGYAQIQSRVTQLRREGRIPYSYIADMSRRGYFVDTFDGAADFIARVKGLYRSDLWAYSDHRAPEVWCESRSIASVIQSDCRELAVSLYPCGGFSSITFVYEAAELINETDDGRPHTVF